MLFRKKMSERGNCTGCKNCEFYPYFHYDKSETGEDIEYIKFDSRSAKVINHTTGKVHVYDGKVWTLQK